MKHIFEHTSASWVSYSDYEIKKDGNGTEYITPKQDAKINLYNPMKNCAQIVLDTVNLGLYLITDKKDRNKNDRLIEYAKKYGLMGLMTALPTTAEFITYENVYLPKNHLIKQEMLSTAEYLDYFYPFEKPDFVKRGVESSWSISNDAEGLTSPDTDTSVLDNIRSLAFFNLITGFSTIHILAASHSEKAPTVETISDKSSGT